jgi:predicted CXXCH cytochrome family protein
LAGIILGTLALAVITYFKRVHFFPAPSIVYAQSASSGPARQEGGYVGPEACAGCHRDIWETYRRTGMARSFYRPSPMNAVEDYTKKNTFYHKASDSYFTMLRRDGKYYQRRYQIDFDGKQVNVVEKQVDFIMGSGNHVRAYLHRTGRNTLIELPLAWYTEKGGYWAMNPGYDRPNHDGFRRTITYDCMFCHNQYPEIPAGHDQPLAEPVYAGSLPEGIDCQRCHGPGRKHAQLAGTAGATPEEIRNSIVNPSRLSAQRQMEVCMQCHLETTSFPLPNSIQRYERGPFSYKPGESLGAFILSFDHAAGKGRDDKFEIVNAAYRLRRSACFLKSSGELRCTTCHNPHDIPRGEVAARHYTAVCRQCHTSAFDKQVASGKHPRSAGCTDCHMPKRRTEDVVHVVMTDHYIQRRKPAGDLLAEMAERHETDGNSYRGEVVLYYPEELPHTPENDLDRAVAQVIQSSNLRDGIVQLTAAIERYSPKRAEYYLELAEAWRNNGQLAKALPLYKEAVRRNPKSVTGLQKLGIALRRSGQYTEAAEFLKRAATTEPDNATTWHELGLTYRAQGKRPDAVAALERAVELDQDMPEAFNNLGVIRSAGGEQARAESAFREAIRIQPDYADAHGNLGNLLSGTGDFTEARYHFEISLRLRPDDAATRYNYAVVLGRTRHFDEAQDQLEASLRADPELADAHELLGDMLMAKGQAQAALPHYRATLRIQPEFGRAHLGLGSALIAVGDLTGAIPHLEKAAADSDPAVREEAAQTLRQLGKEP